MKIIAELGSVHDGKIILALKLIKAAAKCGAHIVKFQMHLPEYESLRNAPSPSYFKKEDRFAYFKRTGFKFEQWKKIKKYCEQHKVEFLCSPFSIEAVNLLEKLKVKKYKVPSGEVTNLPLLERIVKTKKPILLSTGMSNLKEIDRAFKICKNSKLTILQCTSKYPCDEKNSGLNVLDVLKKRYKCDVGLSDHTLGFSSGIIASYLGAKYIEKHFTLSKKMYGSDAQFSMEPNEFKLFVQELGKADILKNNPVKKNNIKNFKKMKKVFEKSIVANRNLLRGKKINYDDLAYKKPGDGIQPLYYKDIIGRFLKKNMKKDEKFKWKNLKKK